MDIERSDLDRPSVTTRKRVQPHQLAKELGPDVIVFTAGAIFGSTGETLIEAEGCTQAQLESAVEAHTFNPDYGDPDAGLKAKIRSAAKGDLKLSDAELASALAKALRL